MLTFLTRRDHALGALGCAFVALASSSAMAQSGSYELLLAVDQSARVIRRIDPVSGASLGSFGAGFLTQPSSVAIRGDRAYVLDTNGAFDFGNSRIRIFNYSTGLHLQSIPLSTIWGFSWTEAQLVLTSSGFQIADANPGGGSTYVARYDNNGTLIARIGVNGLTDQVNWGTETDATGSIVYRANRGRIHWNNAGNSVFDNSSLGSVVTGAVNRHLLRVGNTLFAVNATDARINRFAIQANGSLVPSGFIPVTGFQANSLIGLAAGHGNAIYVSGQDATTPANGRIARYDSLTGDFFGAVSTPGLGTVRSMAMVVAPEPGTLFALGVGLSAILARRRRR